MSLVKCLHCGTENDSIASAGYCDNCGKKLSPRAVGEAAAARLYGSSWTHESPTPEPSRAPDDDRDEYEEMRRNERRSRACREAAGTLFVVASLLLVCNLTVLMVPGKLAPPEELVPGEVVLVAILSIVGISGAFALLGIWALFQPLPPATLGLLLYLGLSIQELVFNPDVPLRSIVRIAIKIIIVIALCRAVMTASKAR
jgi:hypothetical protein